MSSILYEVYEYRLARSLDRQKMPKHIAIMLDGNRRWARAFGSSPSEGHRAGADKIPEFLLWCDETGVEVVTLWMLSPDNLARDEQEISALLEIIAGAVDRLAKMQKYKVNIVGDMTLFSEDFKKQILAAAVDTHHLSDAMQVNVAVGYGGRRELVDAVKSLLYEAAAQGHTLEEVANSLTDEDITEHLYTRGQPDPDLIIRTSGEQRLSGFLLWQSAHSEYYFCDTYWPDFRRIDFLRALRSYSQRERRLGR